jgi:hypothetical protein
MASPSPEDLEILRRLAQTSEGRLLVRVFQSRLVEIDRVNRRAIGEKLLQGQGRALELEEILTELFGLAEGDPAPMHRRQPTRPAPVERYRVNHMAD